MTVALALSALALAPAAASASSVGSPSISVTSTAAGATNVNYLVTFTATHALAANTGTITLAAASGTAFPSGTLLDVFDLTSDTDLGTTSALTLSNGGATGTWTVGSSVSAGHRIRVTALGVTNPPVGSYSLNVSTSTDTTAVATPSYSVTAAQAVSAPSVTTTSAAAEAANVTYRITFTTSSTGVLAGNEGTITVAAPTGTVLPSGSIDVYDLTDRHDLGTTGPSTLSNGGATATWTVGGSGVPAGCQIVLTVTGVTNPGVGSDQLDVATSSDTVEAQSGAYTISAAHAVSAPSVTMTTAAAGATGVTYQIEFTTSSSGALAAGAGTITLAAPAGTNFAAATSYDAVDLSDGQDLGAPLGFGVSNSGATATWTVNGSGVPAGDEIRLTIEGVTNPAAGSDRLDVTTSSDTVEAQSAAYTVSAARSVSLTKLSLSSSAAGAQYVSYFLSFTSSSTGELAGGGNGSVTVAAPAGTLFSSSDSLTVYDETDKVSLGATFAPTLSNSGATATWSIKEQAWPAGHRIELTIPSVTNPAAGSGYEVTVSTSSDTVAATTAAYSITAPKRVGSPSVALTSTAGNAIGLTYTVDFTASTTGALVGDAGTITVTAPSGTSIPDAGIDVFDLTTDTDLGISFAPVLSHAGASATWPVSSSMPRGHRYQLTIDGVTNPAAASGKTIRVATSSDTVSAITGAYSLTAPQALSSPLVSLTNSVQGATSTYVVTVTTSSTGALADDAGQIKIVAPAGTVISNQGIDVFDLTADTDVGDTFGPTLSNSGATAVWTVGSGVPAGHTIQLTITGVVNPTAGSYDLTVSTSSDSVSATTPTYTITT